MQERKPIRALSIVEYDDGWCQVVISNSGKPQQKMELMSRIDAVNFIFLMMDAGLVTFNDDNTVDVVLEAV